MRASMVDLEMNCSTEKSFVAYRDAQVTIKQWRKQLNTKEASQRIGGMDLQRRRLKLRWNRGQSCTTHHRVPS